MEKIVFLKNLYYTSQLFLRNNWLVFLFSGLFFLFPSKTNLSNVFLFLIICTAIVNFRWTSYSYIFYNTKILWVLSAIYFVVLSGSFFTTASSDWILLHLLKYGKFIFIVAIVLLLTGQIELQRLAFNCFVAAMLFILLSTWLNVWFFLPWSITQNTGWGLSHHVFGDYVTQNVMMSFFVVIAIHKFLSSDIRNIKIFWGLTVVLAVVSITHLSKGRTGVVLLTAGLLTYVLLAMRGKALLNPILALVLALFVGGSIGTSGLMQDRFRQAVVEIQLKDVDNMTSIGHRLYNYKVIHDLILEKPFLGHGTGAYHTEICRVIEKPEWCQIFNWHPHNQFLFFGVDHGLIGMGLFILLILSLYRAAFASPNLEGKLFLSSITSILLVDCFFNSPLFSSRESQFFAYMIALLVSMVQPLRPLKGAVENL